jgi:hypothetical protein
VVDDDNAARVACDDLGFELVPGTVVDGVEVDVLRADRHSPHDADLHDGRLTVAVDHHDTAVVGAG